MNNHFKTKLFIYLVSNHIFTFKVNKHHLFIIITVYIEKPCHLIYFIRFHCYDLVKINNLFFIVSS